MALHLYTILIKFPAWDIILPLTTLLNFFHTDTTSLLFCQSRPPLKMTSLAIHLLTVLPQESLMSIMDKLTCVMLPSINTIFYLTSYSSSYQNTKNYPHKKVHIDLKPRAKPVHHHAYPVPHVHWQTFKKELDHMVNLGILEPGTMWSLWMGIPGLHHPKKGWMYLSNHIFMLAQ